MHMTVTPISRQPACVHLVVLVCAWKHAGNHQQLETCCSAWMSPTSMECYGRNGIELGSAYEEIAESLQKKGLYEPS